MTSTWAVLRQMKRVLRLRTCRMQIQVEVATRWRIATELTKNWQYRFVGMVALMPWWLVATGHTQESGAGCSAQLMGAGCEVGRKNPPDRNEMRAPAAAQPIVTYIEGKLTVTASNASLAEVLRAISAQTGTVIDFPAGSAADRIFLREGPGTVREVLEDLLNGSDFNYVILGSPDSPNKLARVILAKAGEVSDFSPQPEREEKSRGDNRAKEASDPLFWTPPSGSAFWTPPKEDPAAQDLHRPLDSGSLVPPSEPLPPDVLEQMMKDRARQLREQAQEPQ